MHCRSGGHIRECTSAKFWLKFVRQSCHWFVMRIDTGDARRGWLKLCAIASYLAGGCLDSVRARTCRVDNLSKYPGLRLGGRRWFCIDITARW